MPSGTWYIISREFQNSYPQMMPKIPPKTSWERSHMTSARFWQILPPPPVSNCLHWATPPPPWWQHLLDPPFQSEISFSKNPYKGRPPKSRIFKPPPSPCPGVSEFPKPPLPRRPRPDFSIFTHHKINLNNIYFLPRTIDPGQLTPVSNFSFWSNLFADA